jgi:hypothetical protein
MDRIAGNRGPVAGQLLRALLFLIAIAALAATGSVWAAPAKRSHPQHAEQVPLAVVSVGAQGNSADGR